jgi:tetratricopeptide (TPR) repeat protein
MTPRVGVVAVVVLSVFFVSRAVCGQNDGLIRHVQGAAGLEGVVHDERGGVIVGATVGLQSKDETQSFTAHTDSAGGYRFVGLRGSVYTLRAEMAGYEAAIVDSFVLGANEVKKVDLRLEAANASGAKNASLGTPGNGVPEFFDEPKFTVAGVTDAASPGGHGSNVALETTEMLAKETVSLGTVNIASGNVSAGKESSTSSSEEDQAGVHHLRAEAAEKAGNPLDAVREYQRAAELQPSESNLFDWGAELLMHRGFEPATEVFSKGHGLFPQSARMLSGLGVAWYARGSYELAFQRVCEASDVRPDDPQPYLFLGKMQNVEAAQPKCVAERLARFARLQSENPLANYYYAVNLWKRQENHAQVESLLSKAVRLDPQLGAGYLQLGIVYSERGDLSAAILAYQKAIEVDPALEAAHYRLAQVYERRGEKLKAQQELTLYQQVSKKKEADVERAHREIQEFVYTLQGAKE